MIWYLGGILYLGLALLCSLDRRVGRSDADTDSIAGSHTLSTISDHRVLFERNGSQSNCTFPCPRLSDSVFLMRKVPEFVRSCDLACGSIIVVYCVSSVAAYVCCVCVIVTICVVFCVCVFRVHLCDLFLAPPPSLHQ